MAERPAGQVRPGPARAAAILVATGIFFAARFVLLCFAVAAAATFTAAAEIPPLMAADSAARPVVVMRAGSRPSAKGPEDHFTGSVRVDPLSAVTPPSRVSTALVTFEPGARSAWHTHPLGQTLIVTAGVGRVQRWGMPADEIRPGDVVWIPPGQKHWHGAAPETGMSHIAIQETVDGKNVDWLEKVADGQYLR